MRIKHWRQNTGGCAVFYFANWLTSVVLAYVDPNLRPALKFYQQLKPLLRAMRNGLVRFAIGYGFTIFIFAGLYMALYRTNASNFQFPTAVRSGSPDVWDFIYFSVTTMTTIGLSEVKPRVWASEGWVVVISDGKGKSFGPAEFDDLLSFPTR